MTLLARRNAVEPCTQETGTARPRESIVGLRSRHRQYRTPKKLLQVVAEKDESAAGLLEASIAVS
jgi:hypothetical protein